LNELQTHFFLLENKINQMEAGIDANVKKQLAQFEKLNAKRTSESPGIFLLIFRKGIGKI
jgi:hypothetical protein